MRNSRRLTRPKKTTPAGQSHRELCLLPRSSLVVALLAMTLFAAPFGGALIMSLIACAFNWNRAPLPFGVDLMAGDMEIASGVRMPLVLNGISKNHSAWLAAGETADDGTLLGMNFYVEGIEGELPK